MKLQTSFNKGFKITDDKRMTVNIEEDSNVKKLDDGLWINRQQGTSKSSASVIGKITYPDFDGDGTVTETDLEILKILCEASEGSTIDMNEYIDEDVRDFITSSQQTKLNSLIGDTPLIFTKDMLYMMDIDQDGKYTLSIDNSENTENVTCDYDILNDFLTETSSSASIYKNNANGWKNYLIDKLNLGMSEEKIYTDIGKTDDWTILEGDVLKPGELGRPIYCTGKQKKDIPSSVYDNWESLRSITPDGRFTREWTSTKVNSSYGKTLSRGYKINPDVVQRIYSMCSRDIVTSNRKSPIPISDDFDCGSMGLGENEYAGRQYSATSEKMYGCEWRPAMLRHTYGGGYFVADTMGCSYYPPICQTTLNRYSLKTMEDIVNEINYPLGLGHRSTTEPQWSIYNDSTDKRHKGEQPKEYSLYDYFDNKIADKELWLYPKKWQVPSIVQDRVYYPLEQGDLFQLTDTIFPMHFYINLFGGYLSTFNTPYPVGEWYGCNENSFRDNVDQWNDVNRGKMNFECGQRPYWGTTQALFVVKEVEWEFIETVSYERINVSYDRKRLTKLSLQLLWCNDELAPTWGPVGTIHTYPESP